MNSPRMTITPDITIELSRNLPAGTLSKVAR